MRYLSILFIILPFVCQGQSLEETARNKITVVQSLIETAESAGLSAYKEKMTVRTAEIFLRYANWDEANTAENTGYFEDVAIYRDSAEQMALLLPDFERREVIIILDEAIAYLERLIAGEVHRKPTPIIDWAEVEHTGDQLTFGGKPVFLSDYTWKPTSTEFTAYHGNQDGFFLTPGFVTDETGSIRQNVTNELAAKPEGTIGFIFLNNKNVPAWSKDKYGNEFELRLNTYTNYDIDSPGAREMMGMLLAGTVPRMAGKKYSELGYMLCNEPHFFVKEGEWASGPVTHYTIDKFKAWLQEKHGNIDSLNTLWNTSFSDFESIEIAVPIAGALQGSPQWYDFILFNQERVTEWYRWLKSEIRTHDPAAKIHLKIMPNLWSEERQDHGIDFEALTRLSEISGNDAGARNNHMWGPREWWEDDYAYDWRELAMSHDFMRSVAPNQIIYNTELHYLSTVKSRDLYQDPAYARATFWLAHTMGMTASQTWFWPRYEDGSLRPNPGNGYAGSNSQQPRITNEVGATMIDLNAHGDIIMAMQRQRKPIRLFYSKTSAINAEEYIDHVFDQYQSLFFEGVPLGFATKDIISLQDHEQWDAVIIHATPQVTSEELASLQDYLDGGGTILLDGESLLTDEYGRPHVPLTPTNGTIVRTTSVNDTKQKALSLLSSLNRLSVVNLTETNGTETRGVSWKTVIDDEGKVYLSAVNLGNKPASLEIELKGANNPTLLNDLLNGIPLSPNPTLGPNEVLFVEVSEDRTTQSIGHTANKSDKLVKMYPNPSSGSFILDFFEFQQEATLTVYDSSGKVVFNKKFTNIRKIEHTLADATPGSYLLEVNAGGKRQQLVLLKQ
ncbi:T9SS type A sorting domain-containing protein [Neolewinella aurantiaca]|uniref:T9SS type A sorting domain-containing protein n=1 Tax=Neolewinella aurantiaca TaxID=2602767 RepID=A0A5C7FK63_9BACT|nr:beta-galactosidase [Neolewinella aurantiaca]TXF86674.1 T9SS type A sorting domain-containing protein [Neolewinella aurantiaca]